MTASRTIEPAGAKKLFVEEDLEAQDGLDGLRRLRDGVQRDGLQNRVGDLLSKRKSGRERKKRHERREGVFHSM